jgi:two-component sensor histidine kinase
MNKDCISEPDMGHSGMFSKTRGRLSMAFVDRNKEERFLSQQRDNTAEHLRWACIAGAAIMIGFVWQDAFFSAGSYKAVIIRIFGSLPVSALAWYLSRNLRVRRAISYISVFFWLVYTCLTMALFITYGPGPYGLTSSIGLGSFLLILFGVFTFSNLRLWLSILVGLSILLIYTVSVALWTEAVFADFIMGDFLTAMALMIALAAKNVFTERAQRRQFETSELLQQSYATVELEVRERTTELQVSNTMLTAEIVERKRAEEQIQASLKEKEILLQEIHHRVKNNLQIISGLLTLQANEVSGKSLDEIFQESQNRIRSMVLIHEKLYSSHTLAEIDFSQYLPSLIDNLFTTFGIHTDRVTAIYKIDPIFFTIEKAVPLGLIVNELVSNCLKHAFPGTRKGEIRIELHAARGRSRRSAYELAIEDNGVGLPSGFKTEPQKSLGMNLIAMLAKQIHAKLKVGSGPGACFRLDFSK